MVVNDYAGQAMSLHREHAARGRCVGVSVPVCAGQVGVSGRRANESTASDGTESEGLPVTRTEIFDRVRKERARQFAKFGTRDIRGLASKAPLVALAVLMEEVGEVAKSLIDSSDMTVDREELVQVAAVAIGWLEGLADE